MTEHTMKLSDAMREVLDRLACGARLKRYGSCSSWSTDGAGADGGKPGWHCAASTVAALERRGLIHSPGQDDRPWSEREFVLKHQDLCEAVNDPSPMPTSVHDAWQQLHDAIQKEAFLISMERQDGDAYGHWFEAERRVLERHEAVVNT